MPKTSLMLAITLLSACSSSQAQRTPLFATDESRLSAADQAAIHASFTERFSVASDGLHFLYEGCGEIPVETEVVDLNNDGTAEVFIYWGNSCTSGHTGRSLSLYVKDSSGAWGDQLGFAAFDYTILPASNAGYPDLEFGGPGFCFAVWSWNGSRYDFKCNSPQEAGGCQYTGNVCQTE
ncbi:MAG: hypothetical protein OEW64_06450 [Gammaproteobacteria bacterium]|nr:hypothetical protein [Gammaproteobacteria bacterium]MDH5303719.1 hypothetical protein [Gammaproteobacteria bacterium]MDH5322699.1 hypothetical protein [Gammaproteobacteria bacterium]